jgi:hypothetical protein
MLVPRYWAEHREEQRARGRKVVVRRFGWSDESEAAALAHARERVNEALAALAAGERLSRFEPKVPYNGADGVPIREEIVETHGDVVITRNAYGARCLNTPDVLFADVDLVDRPGFNPFRWMGIYLLAAGLAAYWFRSGAVLLAGLFLAFALPFGLHLVLRALRGRSRGPERRALERIHAFAGAHPSWTLRIYRTPAGFRVLVTHRTFAPDDPEVGAFFEALGTDRIYVRMCRNQRCFRARLSPKPWRIGVKTHIRPVRGAWPAAPEVLPLRRAWVADYEARSRDFAACRFVEELGDRRPDPRAEAVRELHDRACRVHEDLPLA